MMSSVRDTSLESYYSLREEGVLGKRQIIVLRAIASFPESTDMELVRQLCFCDANMLRPRRNELVKAGLVVPAGKRECSITHRFVYVWRASHKGLEVLERA